MKKTKIISAVVIIFAVIFAILFYNKSKLNARAAVAKIDAYPVTTAKVKMENVSNPYVLVGTLQGENDVNIISETQGKVVKVAADVGDYLNKDEVVVYVDDELEKAALQAAEAAYNRAKSDFKRFSALHKGNTVTDSQLEAAKQVYKTAEANYIVAKRRLKNTRIKTPISGVVTARYFDYGEYIKSGKPVANVVNIKKLKITINVSESVVFDLKVGGKVNIKVGIYPDYTFKGEIKTISDKGDISHKYPVEIILLNKKDRPLKAGMFARVIFNSSIKEKLLLIPRDALIGSIKDPSVFVVKNRIAILTPVSIGRVFDNQLEVIKGVDEGEEIIVDGQFNIKNNYPVKIIKTKNEQL